MPEATTGDPRLFTRVHKTHRLFRRSSQPVENSHVTSHKSNEKPPQGWFRLSSRGFININVGSEPPKSTYIHVASRQDEVKLEEALAAAFRPEAISLNVLTTQEAFLKSFLARSEFPDDAEYYRTKNAINDNEQAYKHTPNYESTILRPLRWRLLGTARGNLEARLLDITTEAKLRGEKNAPTILQSTQPDQPRKYTPGTNNSESSMAPKPTWEQERQRVVDVLRERFRAHEFSGTLEEALVYAQKIYEHTRSAATPFFTQFPDGEQQYFYQVASNAFQITNEKLYQRQGDQPKKTDEQTIRDHSRDVILHFRERDYAAKVKEQANYEVAVNGQTFTGETANIASTRDAATVLKELKGLEFNGFGKIVDDYDRFIRSANTPDVLQSPWFQGLQQEGDRLHKKLAAMAELKKEKGEGFDEQKEINEIAMEFIDNMERAFTSTNRPEWVEAARMQQEKAIAYLDEQGIARRLPKIGDPFDPMWQESLRRAGEGENIKEVSRGAFVNKSNGNPLPNHAAQVVIG